MDDGLYRVYDLEHLSTWRPVGYRAKSSSPLLSYFSCALPSNVPESSSPMDLLSFFVSCADEEASVDSDSSLDSSRHGSLRAYASTFGSAHLEEFEQQFRSRRRPVAPPSSSHNTQLEEGPMTVDPSSSSLLDKQDEENAYPGDPTNSQDIQWLQSRLDDEDQYSEAEEFPPPSLNSTPRSPSFEVDLQSELDNDVLARGDELSDARNPHLQPSAHRPSQAVSRRGTSRQQRGKAMHGMDPLEVLHLVLGHPPERVIRRMSRHNMVHGLYFSHDAIKQSRKLGLCPSCFAGDMREFDIPSNPIPRYELRPFQCLSYDETLYPVTTIEGYIGAVLYTCLFSKRKYIYGFKKELESYDLLDRCIHDHGPDAVSTSFPLRILLCDSLKMHKSKRMLEQLRRSKHKIHLHLSAPFKKQQNAAEPAMRVVKLIQRKIMFYNKATPPFLHKAAETACLLDSFTPSLGMKITKYEASTGIKPDVSWLVPWFSTAFYRITPEEREGDQYKYRAGIGIVIGFSISYDAQCKNSYEILRLPDKPRAPRLIDIVTRHDVVTRFHPKILSLLNDNDLDRFKNSFQEFRHNDGSHGLLDYDQLCGLPSSHPSLPPLPSALFDLSDSELPPSSLLTLQPRKSVSFPADLCEYSNSDAESLAPPRKRSASVSDSDQPISSQSNPLPRVSSLSSLLHDLPLSRLPQHSVRTRSRYDTEEDLSDYYWKAQQTDCELPECYNCFITRSEYFLPDSDPLSSSSLSAQTPTSSTLPSELPSSRLRSSLSDARSARNQRISLNIFRNHQLSDLGSRQIAAQQYRSDQNKFKQQIIARDVFIAASIAEHPLYNAPLPDSIEKALAPDHPEREQWAKALKLEEKGLAERNCWTHEYDNTTPASRRPVKSKVVLRKAPLPNGDMKFKCRIVACGYSQVEGLNFSETYAATAKFKSFMILMNLSAIEMWHIKHLDVTAAFVESTLTEDVFMVLPKILWKENKPVKVKLIRSLYGLKQAGHEWFNLLSRILRKAGCHPTLHDPCVWKYLSPSTNLTTFILVYVDDLCWPRDRGHGAHHRHT